MSISLAQPTDVQTASLLEASRRVDWRFMLPDPTLGTVALAGKASQSLWEALSLFSEMLTQVKVPLNPNEFPFQYDLVVICGSLDQQLASTLELVKPGGFVYIEFKSSFRGSDPLAHNVNTLKRWGFTDIRCHWHSPNFEACKRMIPLDNLIVLNHVLNKSNRPVVRRVTKLGVSLVARSGVLGWSGHSLSLIARRGEA